MEVSGRPSEIQGPGQILGRMSPEQLTMLVVNNFINKPELNNSQKKDDLVNTLKTLKNECKISADPALVRKTMLLLRERINNTKLNTIHFNASLLGLALSEAFPNVFSELGVRQDVFQNFIGARDWISEAKKAGDDIFHPERTRGQEKTVSVAKHIKTSNGKMSVEKLREKATKVLEGLTGLKEKLKKTIGSMKEIAKNLTETKISKHDVYEQFAPLKRSDVRAASQMLEDINQSGPLITALLKDRELMNAAMSAATDAYRPTPTPNKFDDTMKELLEGLIKACGDEKSGRVSPGILRRAKLFLTKPKLY